MKLKQPKNGGTTGKTFVLSSLFWMVRPAHFFSWSFWNSIQWNLKLRFCSNVKLYPRNGRLSLFVVRFLYHLIIKVTLSLLITSMTFWLLFYFSRCSFWMAALLCLSFKSNLLIEWMPLETRINFTKNRNSKESWNLPEAALFKLLDFVLHLGHVQWLCIFSSGTPFSKLFWVRRKHFFFFDEAFRKYCSEGWRILQPKLFQQWKKTQNRKIFTILKIIWQLENFFVFIFHGREMLLY